MKKLLLLLTFFALAFTSQASTHAELFTMDENLVTAEMAELNALENYLSENQDLTLGDLKAAKAPFSTDLLDNLAINAETPLGVPPFVWGCCFGVAGVLVVHLVAEDKEMTKKALYGCATGAAVSTVAYVIYVAAVVSSTN